jgi:hypothetical protein
LVKLGPSAPGHTPLFMKDKNCANRDERKSETLYPRQRFSKVKKRKSGKNYERDDFLNG